MASRSQSAVEYIKNARTHLVGGLQNISVIVVDLYQRGVFTKDEIWKIRTEKDDYDKTRTILDWVTDKGEAACYELLKIIDITRKRTLKRPVSKEAASTSMQMSSFDLHHWISCFFFIDVVEIIHSKVWSIDLSKRNIYDLLEALKLQPEKKPVELPGWSDEESDVRIFLKCLPYISQLSVYGQGPTTFLGKLICEAAEQEEGKGEILELLSSLCNYKTFPFIGWISDGHKKYQCDVLLYLYSYLKNYETQTGRSVLPTLQPVYQSAPAVWYIDLSERKVSFLLEVLKLQLEKKPVKLTGWSDEESEVRTFLQCLPYISQLRCRKHLLLQLLSSSERNTVMRARSLAGALVGELDLSWTRPDQKACRCLALVLEHSEGLTELDLSHCHLNDQLVETLIPHLHKAQVVDLRHNKLTDVLTDRLLQLPSLQTVRLFMDTTPFLKDRHFEMSPRKEVRMRCEDVCVSLKGEGQGREFTESNADMEAGSDHDEETSPYRKVHEPHGYLPRGIATPSVATVSPHSPMLPSPSVSQQAFEHVQEEMSTTDHPVTESLICNRLFKDRTPFLKDFEMMEADSDHNDDDDVAYTTPYQKQLEGHSSQDFPRGIVPPSVAIVSPHSPMLPSPSVSQQAFQHFPEEMMPCDTACDCSTTDHPVTVSLSSPHPSLELQDETDLSRCFSGCRIEESSSLLRSHSLPSLSQSPCIGNKAKRSHSLNDVTVLDKTQKMTPDIVLENKEGGYRFHCTQAGLFQCRMTGLVFKIETETYVNYRTVPWKQKLLAQLSKRPAGPLFDIKCPQGSVCQLHLQHCEILSMGGGKSLYVVHVTDDDGIEFIKPDVITETHVIINITGISRYGLIIFTGVKRLVNLFFNSPTPNPIHVDHIHVDPIRADPIRADPSPVDPIPADPIRADPIRADPIRADPIPADPIPEDPIRALALLFYTPPTDDNPCSILKVLLLPGNVVLDEVLKIRRKRHGEEIYIEVPPFELIPKQEYTLSTSPQDDSIIIQPKKAKFGVDEASYTNYMATFDLISKERFRNDVRLLLKPLSHSLEMPVVDSNTSDCVLDCYVPLSAPALRRQQVEHTLSLEVKDRLFSVRSSFIDSISAPNLKCVVDKLFEKRMLTEVERETAEGMQGKHEKATFVIDTVRKKGAVASASLILILCEIDLLLSGHLGLT